MKRYTRKLSALFLALLLLLSIASTALAISFCPNCSSYMPSTTCTYCGYTTSGEVVYSSCSNAACNGYLSTAWSFNPLSPSLHHQVCSFCNTISYGVHNYNTAGRCVDCGYYNIAHAGHSDCSNPACDGYLTNDWTLDTQSTNLHYQQCSFCYSLSYGVHTYNNQGICTACGYNSTYGNIYPGTISLTIPQTYGVYCFTDATQSGLSVYDALCQSVYALSAFNPRDYYVTFTIQDSTAATLQAPGYTPGNNYITGYNNTVTCRLSELSSLYLYISSAGSWSASYTISLGNTTQIASGTLTISITGSTGSDIVYGASLGSTVALSKSDFNDFWQQYTNNSGTLNYVQITSVSGLSGTLCYNHTGTETYHQSTYGSAFYYNPTAQQKDLAKLSFVPNKTGNTYPSGTVTIQFIAFGTTSRNTINAMTSVSGTINITYAKTDVQGITYDATGGYVTLSSSDFTSVYKQSVSSIATTPYFSIKFLDLPTYGKLYTSYSAANLSSLRNELTAANIDSYSFYNSISGTSSIDSIAYVPNSNATFSETIRYAAYSGNNLLYIGTVTFNTRALVISYDSSSAGVNFSAYDFYSASSSLYSAYITFGTPSRGTLYKNYYTGNGTVLTAGDIFAYNPSGNLGSLSNITYVPPANFTGVVDIPFYVTTLTNTQVAGSVRIYVVAKDFSDVITGQPGGWAKSYINRLYASGVVSGTSATTFSPNSNMKYGEALKMILLAAGYDKQSETGGTHWASNYLSLAYRNGIVSSTNVDLNAYIDRNTIAEITAKALGLSYATSINSGVIAPSDSSNGYVYALYNAGILNGTTTNGVNKYNGTDKLTRAEMAKIVCMVMDYDK